jgi:5-methylthioadenosine/S-adenosylhomocysteine deaminase
MVPQHLAYMASGQDVHTVIVNGQIVMRDRQVLTADEPTVLRDAERAFGEMVERADLRQYLELPEGFWGSVRY